MNIFNNLFKKKLKNLDEPDLPPEMKYLIAGLGNIGPTYKNTRHNIGFQVIENIANEANLEIQTEKYSLFTEYRYKGRKLILLKPTTYMNLSGKAINFWLNKEKIPIENMLVIVDDISIPFGTIRIKLKGSDGGHNGLSHISETIGHQNFIRMRFGIGNEFSRGKQVDYVLGQWSDEENKILPERIDKMKEAVRSFVTIGAERTMNLFNGK